MTDSEIQDYAEASEDLCDVSDQYSIEEQIKMLEDHQSDIQERLDKLYEIKQDGDKNFRDNLVGKCFKRRDSYIKVLNKLTSHFNFLAFEFNKNFKFEQDYSHFNTIERRDIFVQTLDYFEDWIEISDEEYEAAFNELITNIKNRILSSDTVSRLELPKPPEPVVVYETLNGKEDYWLFGKRKWKMK